MNNHKNKKIHVSVALQSRQRTTLTS